MFRRFQVVKRRECVLERKDLFVDNWLQVDLVLCEEVAQVLLLLGGSDANSSNIRLAIIETQHCNGRISY
jgi:hypothetical protein